jgi:hypothetical protein
MYLMDDEQTRAHIERRLTSEEWWVFPLVGPEMTDLIGAIEERHYLDEASPDLEVIMGPIPDFGAFGVAYGALGVAFAHKRRMSADELAMIINGEDAELANTLRTRDVVALAPAHWWRS